MLNTVKGSSVEMLRVSASVLHWFAEQHPRQRTTSLPAANFNKREGEKRGKTSPSPECPAAGASPHRCFVTERKNVAFVGSSENERTIAKRRTRRHSHLEELHCRKQGSPSTPLLPSDRERDVTMSLLSSAAADQLSLTRESTPPQLLPCSPETEEGIDHKSTNAKLKTQAEESSDGHQGRGSDHGRRNQERECGSGIRRRSWSRSNILSRSSGGEDGENDGKEEDLHDVNLRHLRNNDAFCGLSRSGGSPSLHLQTPNTIATSSNSITGLHSSPLQPTPLAAGLLSSLHVRCTPFPSISAPPAPSPSISVPPSNPVASLSSMTPPAPSPSICHRRHPRCRPASPPTSFCRCCHPTGIQAVAREAYSSAVLGENSRMHYNSSIRIDFLFLVWKLNAIVVLDCSEIL
nr:hypothetical protein Iba_chr08fCG0410 [Ipomoea batatas]